MPRPHRFAHVAAAVGASLLVGACSGGQKSSESTSSTRADGTTTSTTAVEVSVDVEIATSTIVGVGVAPDASPPIDPTVVGELRSTIDRYVEAALTGPLTGAEADWTDLVTMAVAGRLAVGSHDRGVITTEGQPNADSVDATLAPVTLTGLTEGFGSLPLVTASIDFTADMTTADGPLTVRHFGEVVLTNIDGWKLHGYEMIVVRDDHAGTPTTLTASTTGTTP